VGTIRKGFIGSLALRLDVWFITAVAYLSQASKHPPTTDEPEDDRDDGDHQQQVNQATKRVRREHSKQPENDQNDGEGFQHGTMG
jgi:hypothetical protein